MPDLEWLPAAVPSWRRLGGHQRPRDGILEVSGRGGRPVVLVDTVSQSGDVTTMVDMVVSAVRRAAEDSRRHDGRKLPLVGLPLPGTGEGTLAGRRREVVAALVPALRALVQECEVDVALTLWSRQDLAAVQSERHDQSEWGLPESLLSEADRLGLLAAQGQVSLFVGAGVSVPVGLPHWDGLIERLAEEAGRRDLVDPERLEDSAESLRAVLGADAYESVMVREFHREQHGLSHALLAMLRTRQLVTTNFDNCLELALDPLQTEGGYRVLTRALADGASPWLLKLHGDIARPRTLVLTQSDYDRLGADGRALYGVIQALLLTSHLVFVGFSLRDADFLALIDDVRNVRRQAESDEALPTAGTALALHPQAIQAAPLQDEIKAVWMTDDPSNETAARQLEIFLDRVAWKAHTATELSAEFLLDDRYASGHSEEDAALRESVMDWLASLSPTHKASVGWEHLRRTLEELGADPASLNGGVGRSAHFPDAENTVSRVDR
ncbi:SIR2 family NAD-dependent protein deacylase [Knoellia sinensis]|nr:SIR2 family protein [Knoellia sinensis]